jgi:acyl-coenzyme A thioesterase PaaI-like protein
VSDAGEPGEPGDNPFFAPDGPGGLVERLAALHAPVEGRELDRRALADAVRELVQALAERWPTGEALGRAAELARAAAAELVAAGPRVRDHGDYVSHSPVVGRANPVAPPLDVWLADGAVHGTAVLGAAYEGPPGHVHGGFVAAMLDELLGFAQSLSGNPGMTARLSIAYRSPTPLDRPLQLEAHLVRVDGRKIFTKATISDGDRLCAEADGLFLSIGRATFEAMAVERERQRDAKG